MPVNAGHFLLSTGKANPRTPCHAMPAGEVGVAMEAVRQHGLDGTGVLVCAGCRATAHPGMGSTNVLLLACISGAYRAIAFVRLHHRSLPINQAT
jgi:hypothetical protein